VCGGATTLIEREVPWARLTTRTLVARRTERRVYHVDGLNPGYRYGVHNNCLRNMLRGIRERVYAVEVGGVLERPPLPDPGVFCAELLEEAGQLDRLAHSTTPMSYQQFVDLYTGRRRQVYQTAADSLAGRPVHRGDSDSCSFLKAEKINFSKKGDPAPRLIHPRDPRYNVALGVYIRLIEHQLYWNIDRMWGQDTVMKGYNARQVGGKLRQKWDRFNKPVALMLDASRFDQHVSAQALQWEHDRYLKFFHGGDKAELRKLLSWQLRTKCRGRTDDGIVKYVVNGMRFSGDMNTGLGNCLIMSSLVKAWCRKCGVLADLANNGDDCVLVLDSSQESLLDVDGMTRWFRTMGFTLKVEGRATVFERIEFCQAQPVWNGCGWVMCRQHGVAMSKDCVSIKPIDHPRVFDRWRKSIGECGLALASGVPVQQEFYLGLARGAKGSLLTDPVMETGMSRLAEGLEAKVSVVSPEARLSYYLAFDVCPDEQEALEGYLRGVHLAYAPARGEGTYVAPTELRLFNLHTSSP